MKISKFSGIDYPQTPVAARLFHVHVIPQWLKISREMGEASGTFFQYFATGT